jgi:hypothetical protein
MCIFMRLQELVSFNSNILVSLPCDTTGCARLRSSVRNHTGNCAIDPLICFSRQLVEEHHQ